MNIIKLAYKSRMLNLDQIRCDCGTQIRQSVNEDTVAEYAEAMRNGADFPEAVVFWDEYKYILADGFHRHLARARAGFKDIKVEVWLGTRAEAIRWALGANAKHGLRRTNADKRRAVEVALKEFPTLSDRQIAQICAVHHDLVADARKNQLADSASCSSQTRVGADGKERRVPQSSEPSFGDASAPASGTRNQNPAVPVTSRSVNDLKSELSQHLESIKDVAGHLTKELANNPLQPPALKDSQTRLRKASNKAAELIQAILLLPPAE